MALVGFTVAGEQRKIPLSHWQQLAGPKPPEGFKCDGCSCSPDFLGMLALWPAGVIHDYHYHVRLEGQVRNWHSRWLADATLRANMRVLVQLQGGSRLHAWWLPWLYWGRVRIWGGSSYRDWDDGEEPLGWVQLFCEAWGLWKAKV